MALSKQQPSTDFNTKCPICYETLRSPKILRCLHTFCERCLHEYFLSLSKTKRAKGETLTEYCCPVCKITSKQLNEKNVEKWAEKIQSNVVIETIITASGGNEQKCNPCERKQDVVLASVWCNECVEAFCEKCHAVHSKMKLTLSHDVIQIKDFKLPSKGVNLDAISLACQNHEGKELVVFCHDHKKLCCCSCPCLKGRKCGNLSSINEMISESKVDHNSQVALDKMKGEAQNILTRKNTEKSELKAVVETVEKQASEFVDKVKCKLDNFFENFVKQLYIVRDERNTKTNIRIRLLEQFIKNTKHWISMTSVIQEHGCNKQIFLLRETMREQIRAALVELEENLHKDSILNLQFLPNVEIQRIQEVENLGSLVSNEKRLTQQLKQLERSCEDLDITIKPSYRFDNIKVELVSFYDYKDSVFTCGTCVNEDFIVVGDSTKYELQLIDKDNMDIVETVEITENCCRLCLVEHEKYIFVSCFQTSGELYRLDFSDGKFKDARKLDFTDDYVGAMIEHNGHIYIIVDGAIKRFPTTQNPDSSEQMTTCFNANTDCGRNGLGFIENRLIFTTKDKEIECKTMDGTDVFCFKAPEIDTPECIAVLPSGVTLVVDRSGTGSLHIISEDGKRHRTLIEKFERITDPHDIWLDNDGWKFYIAGGEFIEIHRFLE